MTASITTARRPESHRPAPARHRRGLALAGAAGLLLGAGACAADGGTGTAGTGRISYEQVRSTARELPATGPCPFSLDLAAALGAAGVDRPVTPGAKDRPVAEGEVGDGVPAQPWPTGATPPPSLPSMPATPPSAWVTCHFTVGDTPARIDLLAVPENGPVISMLLPHLQRYGNLGVAQLQQIGADQPTAGQTRLTPGAGLVGVARSPSGAGATWR
ncbi:hypothetical protein ABTX81_11380 [Kitasatospora sp. NPDC097605]|uniref:hypothetical protein n=1 Tax=Kitasatospora sp. NPDC097605 TaxID=3157226 RepID=UPI00333469DD